MKGSQSLQRMYGKPMLFLKRHSPAILAFAGAAGVVMTAIMAAKATPKVIELLKQVEEEKGENLTRPETIRLAAPAYIPAAVIGLSAIICIFGANVLNRRKQAAITSAYAFLSQSYQRYRKAAVSVYGEDADSRIKAEAAKDVYIYADGYMLYDAETDQSSEKTLFYDMYSGRYFASTIAAVIQAQYHLNRNFILRGGVTVNEFYEFLGIDNIDGGDDAGWGYELIESGFMWIDFKNDFVEMEDGMECYVISAIFDPAVS